MLYLVRSTDIRFIYILSEMTFLLKLHKKEATKFLIIFNILLSVTFIKITPLFIKLIIIYFAKVVTFKIISYYLFDLSQFNIKLKLQLC